MDEESVENFHKRQIKDDKKPITDNGVMVFGSYDELPLKKTEKLITAIYLVTDFYDDRESLKWSLRSQTLHLSSVLQGLFSSKGGNQWIAGELLYTIKNLIFLLELAKKTNLMSHMNFSILKSEFELLGSVIKDNFELYALKKDVILPEAFFHNTQVPERFLKDKELKGHDKRHDYIRQSFIKNESLSNSTMRQDERYTNAQKEKRKDLILQFLKTKEVATIKDICNIVPNVSGKTVQRELITLIAEGRVKRDGERRWSKYSPVL